jgi:hypothetical protein
MKYERLVGADLREAVGRLRFYPDAPAAAVEVLPEVLLLCAGSGNRVQTGYKVRSGWVSKQRRAPKTFLISEL